MNQLTVPCPLKILGGSEMLLIYSFVECPVSFKENIIASLLSADIFSIFIARKKKYSARTFHNKFVIWRVFFFFLARRGQCAWHSFKPNAKPKRLRITLDRGVENRLIFKDNEASVATFTEFWLVAVRPTKSVVSCLIIKCQDLQESQLISLSFL